MLKFGLKQIERPVVDRAAAAPALTPPTNVIISNISPAGFKITWTASKLTGATGTIVYNVGVPVIPFPDAKIPKFIISGTSAVASEPSAGSYKILIRAKFGTLEVDSDPSDYFNIPYFKARAPLLAGPSGTNLGPLGATFSWSGSTSNVPLTYSLIVNSITGATGITGTTKFVSLSAGSTYSCKVLAVAGSTSTSSNTVNVVTPSIFKPAAPVLAGPTGSNLGPLGATLSWKGSTSNVPVKYSLIVDSVTGPTGITGTSKFVSLSAGSTHTCNVVAVAGDKSTSSNTVSVNIPIFKPKAPSLSGPTGSLIGVEGVTLRWTGSTSNVPLTYSLVVDSVTGRVGLTGTSQYVDLLPGLHTSQVFAVAGSTSIGSNIININLPSVLAPTAPVLAGPTGTNLGPYGATLTWSGSTSNVPVKYSVLIDGQTGYIGITGTSKFVSIPPNRLNTYKVVAIAGDKSTSSNTIEVTIPVTKPSKPVLIGPTGSNVGPLGATLSWKGSTSNLEVIYNVLVNGNTGSDTSLTYAAINFAGSTSLNCQVIASNSDRNLSTASDIITVVPAAALKPSKPVLSVPTGSNIGPYGATLSWSPSISNVPLTYSLLVNGKTGFTGLTETLGGVTFVGSTAQNCQVIAYAGNIFTPSDVLKLVPPALFKPKAPVLVGPSGSLIGLTGVTFSWGGSTSNVPLTYSLIVDSVTGPTGLTGTSRFVSLSAGSTHTCRVLAVAGTTFTSSNTVSVNIIPATSPTKPEVTPTYGSNSVTLTWSASTSNVPVTYKISYSGPNIPYREITNITTTSYTIDSLEVDKEYYFTVIAVAGLLETSSDPLTAKIPIIKPSAPIVTPTYGSNSITLNWTASTSNVPVKYKISLDGTEVVNDLNAKNGTINNLVVDRNYSIVVTAVAGTLTTDSDTLTARIPIIKPDAPVIEPPTYGSNTITLTWSTSTSNVPVKYKITSNGTQIISDLNETTYTINNVTIGYDYSIVVSAVAGTVTTDSDPVNVNIPITQPTMFVVNTPTYGLYNINLSWSASTSSVPVKYKVTSNGNIVGNNLTTTSYTINNQLVDTSYSIVVTAIAGTLTTDSNLVDARIPVAKPLNRYGKFEITSSLRTTNNYVIYWDQLIGNTPLTYEYTIGYQISNNNFYFVEWYSCTPFSTSDISEGTVGIELEVKINQGVKIRAITSGPNSIISESVQLKIS
jgi:hypothetical protein